MNERIKPSESDIARECILDALAEHGQLSLSTLLEVECKGVDRNVAERTVYKLQSLGRIRLNPFSKWELAPPRRDEASEAEVGDREPGRDTEPAPPLGDHDVAEQAGEVAENTAESADHEVAAAEADVEPASRDLPAVPQPPTPSELPHPFEVEAEGAEAEASSDPAFPDVPEPTPGSTSLAPAEPENSTPHPLLGARVLDDPLCPPPPRTIEDVARRVADKPPRDVLADAEDLGLRVSFELEQTREERQTACEQLGRAKADLARAKSAEEQALTTLDSLLQRETRLERLASALAGATG